MIYMTIMIILNENIISYLIKSISIIGLSMTKIISITQQKGGAGKTTLTVNIGCYLASLGYKILLMDTDPQKSLTMWFDLRENYHPNNTIDIVTETFDMATEYHKKYDFILIDTPPHASFAANKVIRLSDYVVIPAQLSPLDIWASQATLDMACKSNIHHILVLNRVPAQGKIAKDLHSALLENELPLARTTIGNRNSFIYAFLQGMGVVESEPFSRATEEIKNLTAEIIIHMQSKNKIYHKNAEHSYDISVPAFS